MTASCTTPFTYAPWQTIYGPLTPMMAKRSGRLPRILVSRSNRIPRPTPAFPTQRIYRPVGSQHPVGDSGNAGDRCGYEQNVRCLLDEPRRHKKQGGVSTT